MPLACLKGWYKSVRCSEWRSFIPSCEDWWIHFLCKVTSLWIFFLFKFHCCVCEVNIYLMKSIRLDTVCSALPHLVCSWGKGKTELWLSYVLRLSSTFVEMCLQKWILKSWWPSDCIHCNMTKSGNNLPLSVCCEGCSGSCGKFIYREGSDGAMGDWLRWARDTPWLPLCLPSLDCILVKAESGFGAFSSKHFYLNMH